MPCEVRMTKPRRHGSRDSKRKRRASRAVDELSSLLKDSDAIDPRLADAAARDILRIGKRHGERPDSGTSRLICRGCESALIPGRTARTRITGGMLVITCENCGRIERSGPDFSGGDSD
ncbi:MAG: hypothetical protein DSY41_02360 [Candidatus Poseidoniales archaeon]|nr:MAG: hypothetical protein DSY41_02360 [Candidatus Poseidoniales archaeon]